MAIFLYILSIAAILTLVFFLIGLFFRFRYALRGEVNDDPERRLSGRVPLDISARIQAAGFEPVAGRTRDLSLKGVFVLSGASITPGCDCQVLLIMPGRNAPIRLGLAGRIARVTAEGMGVEFTAMSRECYDNLSYIIQYNQAGEAN